MGPRGIAQRINPECQCECHTPREINGPCPPAVPRFVLEKGLSGLWMDSWWGLLSKLNPQPKGTEAELVAAKLKRIADYGRFRAEWERRSKAFKAKFGPRPNHNP